MHKKENRRAAQGGDWSGCHSYALIFVPFGYGYFRAELVLFVAEEEVPQ